MKTVDRLRRWTCLVDIEPVRPFSLHLPGHRIVIKVAHGRTLSTLAGLHIDLSSSQTGSGSPSFSPCFRGMTDVVWSPFNVHPPGIRHRHSEPWVRSVLSLLNGFIIHISTQRRVQMLQPRILRFQGKPLLDHVRCLAAQKLKAIRVLFCTGVQEKIHNLTLVRGACCEENLGMPAQQQDNAHVVKREETCTEGEKGA